MRHQLAWRRGDRCGIDEAVPAYPHSIAGLRKVGHHVAPAVVGDDDPTKLGRQVRRLGDHPHARLGTARAGHHTADVVTVDRDGPAVLRHAHQQNNGHKHDASTGEHHGGIQPQ